MNTVTCYDSAGKVLDELCQWDINVTVQVGGADTASAPNFHFCQHGREFAYVVPGEIAGDKIKAKVPNILLQSHYPMDVFLYYGKTDTEQRSIFHFLLPIIPREQPMEYVYKENIGYESWIEMTHEAKEIIEARDELVQKAEEAVEILEGVNEGADRAEKAEQGANDAATRAEESAKKAKTSEDEAQKSATAADESEKAAAQHEQDAKQHADDAKTYMDTSVASAEQAQKSETASKDAQTAAEKAAREAEEADAGAKDALAKTEEARDTTLAARDEVEADRLAAEKAREDAEASQKAAKESETKSKESETNAKASEEVALQKAAEVEQNAEEVALAVTEVNDAKDITLETRDETLGYKDEAEGSAVSAAASAEMAKQYSGKPPKPDTTKNLWQTWNAESGLYEDTDAKVVALLQYAYPSIEAMEADFANRQFGELAIIASNVEDEDNSRLFIRDTDEWKDLGDLSGVTGNGIKSWEKTGGTGLPGSTDEYTMTWTDGRVVKYTVYNGRDGQGVGDMEAVIYDTKLRRTDIFDYVDNAFAQITVSDDDDGNVTLSFPKMRI